MESDHLAALGHMVDHCQFLPSYSMHKDCLVSLYAFQLELALSSLLLPLRLSQKTGLLPSTIKEDSGDNVKHH